jgi:hypothetical protein
MSWHSRELKSLRCRHLCRHGGYGAQEDLETLYPAYDNSRGIGDDVLLFINNSRRGTLALFLWLLVASPVRRGRAICGGLFELAKDIASLCPRWWVTLHSLEYSSQNLGIFGVKVSWFPAIRVHSFCEVLLLKIAELGDKVGDVVTNHCLEC